MVHSLPPILYRQYRIPVTIYSEAPWGLSVLSRVTCIFTSTTISPGALLRQCPSHYAIRAGQNLPDKEFRYLRTVIVTAAVYWGLSSLLRLRLQIPVTFQHRAGVSPYTSSFDLAETCVFDKQLLGPFLCGRPEVRSQMSSQMLDLRCWMSDSESLRSASILLSSNFSPLTSNSTSHF